MLQNASDIKDYDIIATDGHLGTVSDFLFDDSNWRVRWLVVDTGNWLPGRRVLLPPSVLGHLDAAERTFGVRLSRQQIKDSPSIETDQPVSRQVENDVYDYYGWSPYWSTGLYMGGYGGLGGPFNMGLGAGPSRQESMVAGEHYETLGSGGDAHLRSMAAVTGTNIHATDGEIGHVADLLIEDADWTIRYLVADTSNWWAGKKVVIAPRTVSDIAWADGLVNLNVTRQTLRDSPPYDATVTLDRDYERELHTYYDRTRTDATL